MTIMSDYWIKEMAEKHEMISPFEHKQIKELNNQNIDLVFDGLDTFSEIYLNGN